MGFALAEIAHQLGADVTLITGPVSLFASEAIHRINVKSAQQMFEAVQIHYAAQDVFISAAAVADFRPEQPAEHKLKKSTNVDEMTIKLVKNPDIVAWVAQQADKPFVVGFAAETQQLITAAKHKLQAKKLDLICANLVGEGMGFDQMENALTLISATQQQSLSPSSKPDQARQVYAMIQDLMSCLVSH